MPAPITSTSVSQLAGERCALLVGIVVPEREQRGHRQDRKGGVPRGAAYTGSASDAPPHARIPVAPPPQPLASGPPAGTAPSDYQ